MRQSTFFFILTTTLLKCVFVFSTPAVPDDEENDGVSLLWASAAARTRMTQEAQERESSVKRAKSHNLQSRKKKGNTPPLMSEIVLVATSKLRHALLAVPARSMTNTYPPLCDEHLKVHQWT